MIQEEILSEIKAAMLAKDNLKRDCLRGIVAEVKNENLINKKEVTDALYLDVIKKAAKKRNDSIADFKKAGREDLLKQEEAELAIISKWLPKMLGEEETKAILLKVIEEKGLSKTKQNMGVVMKQIKDNAEIDKKLASKLLAGILS